MQEIYAHMMSGFMISDFHNDYIQKALRILIY